MSRLLEGLRRLAALLDQRGTRFALVGGLAVSAIAAPRFTQDVDLALSVDDDETAEALVRDLAPAYRPMAVIEHETRQRLATVRVTCAADGTVFDLLFASSGIEPEVVHAARVLSLVEGLSLPVAVPGHLMALKVLARDDRTRPQDALDLRALINAATDDDLEVAVTALELITARGFHRNRDLVALFRSAVAQFGSENQG